VTAWRLGVVRRAPRSDPSGVLRIPGLPPGRWTVRAYAAEWVSDRRGAVHWIASEVVQAGDTVELTLERVDPEGD
jgi:hypothetical protein